MNDMTYLGHVDLTDGGNKDGRDGNGNCYQCGERVCVCPGAPTRKCFCDYQDKHKCAGGMWAGDEDCLVGSACECACHD